MLRVSVFIADETDDYHLNFFHILWKASGVVDFHMAFQKALILAIYPHFSTFSLPFHSPSHLIRMNNLKYKYWFVYLFWSQYYLD